MLEIVKINQKNCEKNRKMSRKSGKGPKNWEKLEK